jgi:glutathione synthase/RimK-type ligase-like ATP-grasp enzyme
MPSSLIVIGIAGHKRVSFVLAAAARTGFACEVIDWQEVLARARTDGEPEPRWIERVPIGAVVRIESPGQCFAVEQRLLEIGAGETEEEDSESEGTYRRLTLEQVRLLSFDRGAILPMRQWFLGWRRALRYVQAALASRQIRWMNSPQDIETMFDKVACHKLLHANNLLVPPTLGIPLHYDDLINRMETTRTSRIFIKPSHGSSASGVIALEKSGGSGGSALRIRATSPVEIVEGAEGVERADIHLYNSRKVKILTSEEEVRRLVDFMCRERVHTERWMPKESLDGMAFDLRIVVIAGKASHVAVRMSRHPMTNLHLGAQRGDVAKLRSRIGEEAWQRCIATAEDTIARAFPDCHYAGLDVMLTAGTRRPYVLEVNAFGDLMPGLAGLEKEADTYTQELAAWLG